MATFSEELEEEIVLLEAIYTSELVHIGRNEENRAEEVILSLHPATGDEHDKKFVCLELQFFLPVHYPKALPEFKIKNPRGLSEEHITELNKQLLQTAREKEGQCMLYDLIELVKESLTQSNVPQGECAICLESFDEEAVFRKTDCYHYFHCHCLLRYVKYEERQIEKEREERATQLKHQNVEEKRVVCPVCRSPMDVSLEELSAMTPPVRHEAFSFVPDEALVQLQRDMEARRSVQKQRGGLIDLEEERNKFLLPAASVVPSNVVTNSSTDSGPERTSPDDRTDGATGVCDGPDKQPSRLPHGRTDRQPNRRPHRQPDRGRGGRFGGWKERTNFGRRNDRERNRPRYDNVYEDREEWTPRTEFIHTRRDKRQQEKCENAFSAKPNGREESEACLGEDCSEIQTSERVNSHESVHKNGERTQRHAEKNNAENHADFKKGSQLECNGVQDDGGVLATETGSFQARDGRQHSEIKAKDRPKHGRNEWNRRNKERGESYDRRKEPSSGQMTYSERLWKQKHGEENAASSRHRFTFKKSKDSASAAGHVADHATDDVVGRTGQDREAPASSSGWYSPRERNEGSVGERLSAHGRGRGRGYRHDKEQRWQQNARAEQANGESGGKARNHNFNFRKEARSAQSADNRERKNTAGKDLFHRSDERSEVECDKAETRSDMHPREDCKLGDTKAQRETVSNGEAAFSLRSIAGVLSSGAMGPADAASHSEGSGDTAGSAPPGFVPRHRPPPGFGGKPVEKHVTAPPGFS